MQKGKQKWGKVKFEKNSRERWRERILGHQLVEKSNKLGQWRRNRYRSGVVTGIYRGVTGAVDPGGFRIDSEPFSRVNSLNYTGKVWRTMYAYKWERSGLFPLVPPARIAFWTVIHIGPVLQGICRKICIVRHYVYVSKSIDFTSFAGSFYSAYGYFGLNAIFVREWFPISRGWWFPGCRMFNILVIIFSF